MAQRIVNPWGDRYPDDDSVKTIWLQAEGLQYNGLDRHVLFRWINGRDEMRSQVYTQIVHLTGNVGNYNFITPSVKMHSLASQNDNTFYDLGQFTRSQRDKIIELAKAVKFERSSRVNGCRTWMRDLLAAMVQHGLLTQAMFNFLEQNVPLPTRVPEI